MGTYRGRRPANSPPLGARWDGGSTAFCAAEPVEEARCVRAVQQGSNTQHNGASPLHSFTENGE